MELGEGGKSMREGYTPWHGKTAGSGGSLFRLDQPIVTFLIRAINDLRTSIAETSVQLRLKHDGRLNLN
jgi:hypothetical protein